MSSWVGDSVFLLSAFICYIIDSYTYLILQTILLNRCLITRVDYRGSYASIAISLVVLIAASFQVYRSIFMVRSFFRFWSIKDLSLTAYIFYIHALGSNWLVVRFVYMHEFLFRVSFILDLIDWCAAARSCLWNLF